STVPGTTRDALDTPVNRAGHAYLLVDTAGVRRRPRVQEHVERASVVRALRALERAEVALLVIDAVEGMTEQDARVAGSAWAGGRGCWWRTSVMPCRPRHATRAPSRRASISAFPASRRCRSCSSRRCAGADWGGSGTLSTPSRRSTARVCRRPS